MSKIGISILIAPQFILTQVHITKIFITHVIHPTNTQDPICLSLLTCFCVSHVSHCEPPLAFARSIRLTDPDSLAVLFRKLPRPNVYGPKTQILSVVVKALDLVNLIEYNERGLIFTANFLHLSLTDGRTVNEFEVTMRRLKKPLLATD